MNPIIERTIYSFILLPYVLKIFKRDRHQFYNSSSKVKWIYLDMLDASIETVQEDYNAVRQQVFAKYHLNVKYVGKEDDMVQYKWTHKNESGVIWISSAELREKTKRLMSDYLYGPLAVEVTPSGKPWPPLDDE
ncbi:hypothetical protein [Sediminibacillus halophilus]|uniref:Uncharacterized protein n=1 Tax=Sediminibacillus halophilus TaxID=482461 RepID=A0A1G9QWI6_9BACI|nr:hypothetical protein [Sediminibacillus halophilus]SDM15241.1 hypothetical protein SAMN05216244_1697 [Sediminibacillus halophilus]